MLWAIGGPQWQIVAQGTPGAVEVVDDPLPAAGTYRTTGEIIYDDAGTPHRQFTWTAWSRDEAVSFKLGQLETAYQDRLAQGFACTLNGVATALQVASDRDLVNWIAFKADCKDEIDAGNAAANASLPMWGLDNVQHTVTNQIGYDTLKAGQTWVAAMMLTARNFKDSIMAVAASAADGDVDTQLAAIDLTTGWP